MKRESIIRATELNLRSNNILYTPIIRLKRKIMKYSISTILLVVMALDLVAWYSAFSPAIAIPSNKLSKNLCLRLHLFISS